MKWIALAALLAAIPVMTGWLKTHPRQAPLLSGLLGLLIFIYAPYGLAVSPYAMPMWAGYVKGLEITPLDAVALAILIGNKQRPFKIPFQWQMALYLIAVLFAITQSPVPMISSFYLWQLLRIYILFRAVALVAQDERHLYAIIAGLILGVSIQAALAGWARARGAVQSGGSLGHQNLLGMLTNMVLMPCLAMLLAGIRGRWAALGVGASALALVSTASRGAIAIAAVGVGLVLLLVLIRRPSPRKWGVAAVTIMALAVVAPLAMKSMAGRFQASSISFALDSDEGRVKMENATRMMIADHPFGVGPNYFTVMANVGGYWARSGLPATPGNMAATVHNSYLLVHAETGFFGLAVIVVLLLSAVIYPLYVAFRNKTDVRGDILIGLSASFITFALQNRVEWGVVAANVQYTIAIMLGLIAGLSRSIKITALRAKSQRSQARSENLQSRAGPVREQAQ